MRQKNTIINKLRPKRARPGICFYRNIREFTELIPRRKSHLYLLVKVVHICCYFCRHSVYFKMHTNIFCIKIRACMSNLLQIIANINAKKSPNNIIFFLGAGDTISIQHYIKAGNMKHDNAIRLNTTIFKLQGRRILTVLKTRCSSHRSDGVK